MALLDTLHDGDEASRRSLAEVSARDAAIDRWLTGSRLRTLDEFQIARMRLDAESRRLREEGRKLREEIRASG